MGRKAVYARHLLATFLYELPESPDYPSEVTGEAEIFLDLPAGSQLLDSKSFVFSET